MSTCKTCRHWTPADISRGWEGLADYGFGKCGKIRHSEDRTKPATWSDRYYCEGAALAEFSAELLRLAEQDKAVAQDASGYAASLRTHETFGCVLHEEKAT